MQKNCMRLLLAVLLLLPAESALAGRRRCRVRCVPVCCSPCGQTVQCVPGGDSCSISSSPSPAASKTPSRVVSYFPDICPTEPQFPASGGAWTWSAERHYGEGRNCSNCYTEMTTLTGFYDLYGAWPYPCGDAQCEPSSNVQPRARDFDGRRLNADRIPVTLEFDPVSEMPRGTNAHEISPRRFIRIEDPLHPGHFRFFIVYSIRVERMGRGHDTFFGHEVPQAELDRAPRPIRTVAASQVVSIPSVESSGEQPASQRYVFAVTNQDGRNEFILYLNRDLDPDASKTTKKSP